MFGNAWQALRRGNSKLTQFNEPLISFSDDVVRPLGSDHIPMILEGVEGNTFYLRDCDGIIIGHPWNTEYLRFYLV